MANKRLQNKLNDWIEKESTLIEEIKVQNA